ncbi:MAG TPA: hypothetical protein VIS48_10305 [Candidatus Kryptonia bacterium]
MKRGMSYGVIVGALLILSGSRIEAQNNQLDNRQHNKYVSPAGHFSLQYEGTLDEHNGNECAIRLPSSSKGDIDRAYVRVFVGQRPFVYLPGTYGGSYYFDNKSGDRMMSNRVAGDSLIVNGLKFARDYWAVYAGHGEWETVINCYAYDDGQCYVVSLEHDSRIGMPGEIVNGIKITRDQLRNKLVNEMRDTTSMYVKSFSGILGSFSVSK